MRWTSSFIPTLKEDPQEAEAMSHKLMVRAGLIRRLTAGAYTYLPMGYRSLRKAKNIIREEMDRAGATELFMPALQPPELWKKTGRYEDIGDVMIKYKDRHGREVALGPTHEEVITDLVAKEVRSYKDLPLILYQIQTKFRDEVRPRFGVVRSCEFIMKDAYSFDVDADSMEESYKKMYDAYCRIFDRCELSYIAVEADPGLMGGRISHEFMVPSEIGEDRIAVCSSCGYAASTEVAAATGEKGGKQQGKAGKLEEAATPGVSTVENVSNFLKVKPSDLIKTLIYIADDQAVAVLIRGDHEANETKIKNSLKARSLELADEKKVEEVTGGPMGFSGPVGLSSVKILGDNAVRGMVNGVTGANEKDKHLKNVNPDRDFKVDEWTDARIITEKDPCPKCGGTIELKEAIEVGHTFKLGTKYSESLGAKFLNEKGKEKLAVMGCYGIGVNRILAALIENSHDKDGIIWPVSLAPCEVSVIPVSREDKKVVAESEKIYTELKEAGIDVILDDREKTAGVKFKDSDLVGFPLQVVIGKKNLDNGKIEIKDRSTGEKTLAGKDETPKKVKKMLGHG
ncbi:MAG: proline--tRNA ligase [Candidatus Omnitrophota bacterium]